MLEKEIIIKEAENAINWIKEYVEKTSSEGVVVGNSGGKDSATVIAMATKALGKDKVLAVTMPCNSINTDLKDAIKVANKFGVKTLEIELSNTYSEFEKVINNNLKTLSIQLNSEAKINSKPRLRMACLYAIAQSLGYLVIGTGNLSERLVGYTTKWGDSAFDFNPIANFTASEVLLIGEYLGVPETIIKKAPSDGLSGKTDEEKMGVTYKQIEEYIETGKTDEKAQKIIEKLNKNSSHKRKPVPTYYFERNGT